MAYDLFNQASFQGGKILQEALLINKNLKILKLKNLKLLLLLKLLPSILT